jgi:DNA topoisomerase IA
MIQSVFQNFNLPLEGDLDDMAHPPIYPVKKLSKTDPKITDKHELLYTFILHYFLACCSHPSKANQHSLVLSIKDQEFSFSQYEIIDPGYLKYFEYDKWTTTLFEPLLFSQTSFAVEHCSLNQKKT